MDMSAILLCTLSLLLALGSYALCVVYFTHMFQLNSYKYGFQSAFYKKNASLILLKLSPAVFSLFACFFSEIIGYIALIVLFALSILANLPTKAKKPLKFTMRVIRLLCTCALIFAIFVILFFIFKVTVFLSIPTVLSPFILIFADIINKPVENAVRRRYINEAKKKIAALPNLKTIGVTGSYGKTGTKFYLERILGANFNCLMTPESYNTTMGVVKTVREQLSPKYDFFICEMGARNVGEIKEICDIVSPTHGVITSIGRCHLETFKTVENVTKTKFELADAVKGRGYCFLNADNEYIKNRAYDGKAVYYGIGKRDGLSFYAENLSVCDSFTSFDFVVCGGKSYHFETKLLGRHNVTNVLCALSVAFTLDERADEHYERYALAVKRLKSAPHRLEAKPFYDNSTLIDDSFNSNPDGARAAIDALSMFDGAKILITPGMVELGKSGDAENEAFGEYAAERCDVIYTVGSYNRDSLLRGITKASNGCIHKHFDDVLSAIDEAKRYRVEGKKTILIENDLPDNF